MVSFPSLGFTTLAVVAASLLLDWWYFLWSRRRLPPGPLPWPIIGNGLLFKKLGPDLLTATRALVSGYGKILTVWIGKTPVIIVSDATLANDALVKQGAYFANRIKLSSRRLSSSGFMTLNTSEGPLMTTLRRNIMTHMLGPAKLKAFKPLRDAAYDELIRRIVNSATASGGGEAEVNVKAITYYRLLKLTFVLVFGVELDADVIQELIPIMAKKFRLTFRFHFGDYLRIYRLFERKTLESLNAYHMKIKESFEPIIERVRHLQGDDIVIGGNYCETLFQLEKEFPAMDKSVITSLCSEFIDASTHSTAASIDNTMVLLSEHPLVQKKLYQEIEATVGNRAVDESDLPQLPYLSAVVRESLRRNPTARLTIAHATSELRELGGYYIPTDAVLYFNLEALLLNPDHWADPFTFRPERFLENDIDVHGIRDSNFLPFGAGRRVCPGTQLAMLEVSTLVARMVQTFEWRKTPNVDVEGSLLASSISGSGSVLFARPRSASN